MDETREGRPGLDLRMAIVLAWVALSAPVVAWLLVRTASAWWMIAGYETGCLLAIVSGGVSWGERRWGEAFAWAGLTLVVLLPVPWLIPRLHDLLLDAVPVLRHWGLSGGSGSMALVWFVVVNPWIEEVFWRGTLFGGRCVRVLGRRGGFTVSVLGFVPFHLVVLCALFGGSNWWLALPLGLGSVVWATLRLWRRSLLVAVLCHQAADIVLVLVVARQIVS